jgi:hypothetical protein
MEAESRRLRNLRSDLGDRLHLLTTEINHLEGQRMNMERDLWEFGKFGRFEEFTEENWEMREKELEAAFEEKEGRLAEGNEEMKALREKERQLRREKLVKMKSKWD